ncbi:hypothetical protein DL768_011795 [Monosporascus sp. mg162]|nr:hypothetical protein DL768_011795 [Monosporascus sp. mg162]
MLIVKRSAAISTVTVVLTEYMTVVETVSHTASKTETISTKTRHFTLSTTVTASTEINVVKTTETAVETLTTPACLSFEKYAAACSCAGILPTTIIAGTPSTIITVEVTNAVATEYNNSPLRVYANFVGNGQQLNFVWAGSSSSPVATIENKSIWALDSDGNLILANPIPPYTYKYYACVSTLSSGSVWAQVSMQITVQTAINNGGK